MTMNVTNQAYYSLLSVSNSLKNFVSLGKIAQESGRLIAKLLPPMEVSKMALDEIFESVLKYSERLFF